MVDKGFNFQDWYDKNGETLNATRRTRYKSDPEYRDKVLAMNRLSRARRRSAQAEEQREEREAKTLDLRPVPWKTVRVAVPGTSGETTLLSIGAVAKALRMSVQAVRIWEKQGILPPTKLRNAKGDRLYTPADVEALVKLLESRNLLRERPAPDNAVRGFMGSVTLGGKSHPVVLFRIGALARALGRTVVTVEQMEHRGVLPATPFRWSGYRLYSKEMIEAVYNALASRGGAIRGRERWQDFHEEVRQKWTSLGVYDSTLVDLQPLNTD